MKKLHCTHLGHGVTFWEEGANGYQAHISREREISIYDERLQPENLEKIKKMAESGNYLTGNDPKQQYVVLKPLNEAKYIVINPITKQEIRFSVENIYGKMYKCIEGYVTEIDIHPCTVKKGLFSYGNYKDIYVYESYDPKYLLYTFGEKFLKVKYQFIPNPSEVNQMYQQILSGKIALYKLPIKLGDWIQIPSTEEKGEYIGERHGDLILRTSSLQEYAVCVRHFLEIEQ